MIYFIRSQNYVKIGYSRDPWRRISDLQTGNPHRLEMLAVTPGDFLMESELHKLFDKYNENNEWFLYNEKIQRYCDFMKETFPHVQSGSYCEEELQLSTRIDVKNGTLNDHLSLVFSLKASGGLSTLSTTELHTIGISRFHNLPDTPAIRVLNHLRESGYIERVGERQPYYWTEKPLPPPFQQDSL
jgi:hypothetical protein